MATNEQVARWGTHDKSLAAKLRSLYETRLEEWLAFNNGALYAEKWYVGREMLKWFYREGHLSADELEAIQVRYSRPNKPDYELYRIVWKDAGRASDAVAAICTAKRTGPSKGYTKDETLAADKLERGTKASAPAFLGAQEERSYGDGGWLYAYAYELSLQHAIRLGELPLLKVGHTGGEYKQRIAAQIKGTAIPDLPVVLRAYRVNDSGLVESHVHARLVSMGRHHRKAGGAEWFRVSAVELDQIVSEVCAIETLPGPVTSQQPI